MDASGWDDRYSGKELVWSAEPNQFVESRLKNVPPGSGVDLACGEGRNAIWLSRRGWSMVGVDFSPVAIERARSLEDSVAWEVADVTAWAPDSTLDLVLISYLHLGGDVVGDLIRRSVTWLRPGGLLLAVGHDQSNLDDGYGGPQDLGVLWDVDELVEDAEGADVLEAGVVARPVDVEGVTVSAMDALIYLRAPS